MRWSLSVLLLLAVSAATASGSDTSSRWYKPAHAAAGEPLFEQHCAACHGGAAVGDPDWRQRDASGLLRAPPLNGSAHAWHHPLSDLYRQIMTGSAPGVGNMPAFRGVLSRGEALAIIAYFQSLWPDDIYQAWQRMDEAAKQEASKQ
jgi:mono/diheme cytochrome c family protein